MIKTLRVFKEGHYPNDDLSNFKQFRDFIVAVVDDYVGLDAVMVLIDDKTAKIEANPDNRAAGGEEEWIELGNAIIDELDKEGFNGEITLKSNPRYVSLSI